MIRDKIFYKVDKLINYEKENYVTVENKFTRKRKLGFRSFIYYLIGNNGKTSALELENFFKVKYKMLCERAKMKVSKQNLSNQRTYIDPQFFKDANALAIKDIYSDENNELKKFKGYYIFGLDGGEAQLPNAVETRVEYNIDKDPLKNVKTPKARVSVISDLKNDYIIDSTISELSIGEQPLAFENIENSSKIIDFKKVITIFDRNYASSELIIQLLMKESKFIFRLKKNTYKKERKKMETDDEWINITMKKNRTKNIKNKEIRDKAEKLDFLNLRVVNIPLKTGEIETLLTNIPDELATPDELKELYGERWKIETGYDVLKNKIHIENFSGKRKITIEQDFYSQILMYNILIEYKIDCNNQLKEKYKHKKCKCEYKVNINILAGQLKTSLTEMFLADTKEERDLIKQEVYQIAMKNTIKTKTKKSYPRNKNQLSNRYPYNNRKNF